MQLPYGELVQVNRGQPRLRVKGACESSLSIAPMATKTWEQLAEDRIARKC